MIALINTKTGVNEVFETLEDAQAFAKKEGHPKDWSVHRNGVVSELPVKDEPEIEPITATEVVSPMASYIDVPNSKKLPEVEPAKAARPAAKASKS